MKDKKKIGLILMYLSFGIVMAGLGAMMPCVVYSQTGTIISIATIFDIAFNLLFGKIIDQMGYHLVFMILPVSMIIFYLIVNFLIKKYKPLRNLGEA